MKKEKLVDLVLQALGVSNVKVKQLLSELCNMGSNWIDQDVVLGLLTGDIEFKTKDDFVDTVTAAIEGTDMNLVDWVVKTANLDAENIDKTSISIDKVCNVGRFIAFSYHNNDDKWSYIGSINFDKISW